MHATKDIFQSFFSYIFSAGEEPNMIKKIRWTAVVLTSSNKDWTHALQNGKKKELKCTPEITSLTVFTPISNVTNISSLEYIKLL